MLELDTPTEEQKVEAWRLHVLLEAGYPPALAEQLSPRNDVDLHLAVELVTDRGCPAETAYRILL